MASKFLDDSGLAYLWLKIKTLVGGKVDKVDGKGLSTNDYTSNEKTKLANIASGAQVNVLEGIQKNGTNVTVTNKIANITVPTKTSDITNDSGFITAADVPEGAAASTTTPKMNGTAAVGTETAFARGDHVHPSDSTKVDKVTGKGLSTNDYTTAEKQKLAGITAGAEPNVNADWNATSGDAQILNKPTNVSDFTNDTGFITASDIPGNATTSSSGLMSAEDKTKLNGITAGAEVNQNAFSNIKVGTTTVAADAETDTFEIAAGTLITVTGDATTDKITISTTATANSPYASNPAMNGTASAGSAANYSRGDHVHPTDTSRAPVASPTFTGTPKAPTAAAGTNTTQIATTEFVKTAVDTAIAGVTQFSYEVVTSLPTTGVAGKIYLIAHSHGTGDAYDEYIWTGSSFEKIGNTDIDLSGYMLVTDMVAMTNTEIDTACE